MNKNWPLFIKSFTLAFILLFGIGVLVVTTLIQSQEPATVQTNTTVQQRYQPGEDEVLNILLMLCKNRSDIADTYILLQINAYENSVAIARIPADLQSTVNVRTDSIAGLYDYGSIEMAKKGVENLFFIEINRTIRIDDAGLITLVDYLGGMEWNVDEQIIYQDANGEELILQPGRQTIDGRRFCALMRSDYAVEALCSLADQRCNESLVGRLESFLSLLGTNTDTDLTAYDFEYFRKGWEQMMIDHNATLKKDVVEEQNVGNRLTVTDDTRDVFSTDFDKP